MTRASSGTCSSRRSRRRLKSAARKKYGPKIDIEVQYSEETGELEVFQFKEVAEAVEEPMLQISLEEGRQLDPECEVGDSLGTKMDTDTFGRIAAQSAKQVIIQKLTRRREGRTSTTSYKDRKGEIINGIVQRIDRGRHHRQPRPDRGACLPVREQVPQARATAAATASGRCILEVLHESRGPADRAVAHPSRAS
ncbi:MAG: hypothetical protein MZV70_07030 [Desulfobacterales bacterium]|nr:hypothetical protein [Desulfobacterales bacterium]